MRTAIFESVPGKGTDIQSIVTPDSVSLHPVIPPVPEFGFNAHLYGPLWNKVVQFTMLLRVPDKFPETNGRYPNFPSGKQLVTATMKYFDKHNHIKRFTTVWPSYSDNYIAFESNKQLGQSDSDAAMNTWSGKNIASPFHFTKKVTVKPGEYKKTNVDKDTGETKTNIEKAYYVDYYR
jgi:hypothetical protein